METVRQRFRVFNSKSREEAISRYSDSSIQIGDVLDYPVEADRNLFYLLLTLNEEGEMCMNRAAASTVEGYSSFAQTYGYDTCFSKKIKFVTSL